MDKREKKLFFLKNRFLKMEKIIFFNDAARGQPKKRFFSIIYVVFRRHFL